MATQKTVVEVEVTDKGTTEKLNQQAQKTHKTFKDLLKTAGDIAVGSAKRALSMAYAPAAGSSRLMNEAQYGAARGSAGLTGASARDFAKQAEGLNGLVRLYATYAANLYAAGAAFTALSRAMDTENMVRGLDQLGASSGVALGSLSKRLVSATDGAISLRDAMEATVKASSSGMDSTQILRMGKAAKMASQALGVDMNDAVSRITRGITKLEPELLDELGLFIKVDDVVNNYAKSVGKAASAVTDFEKRQAVANAVLTQAEEKFSAIDIDTNPYVKLAATMKDLAQAGLELANKVLAPIANYLSESPTALAIGMAAFVGLIVKQAIPALTQYRESILAGTEEAVRASATKYATAKKYLNLETAQLKAIADREAENAHDRFESTSNAILKSYQDSAGKTKGLSKEVAAIATKNASDISDADLKVIDSYANAGTKRSQVYKNFADSIREYKTLAAASEAEIGKIEAKRIADSEALNKSFAESNKRNLQDMYSSNIRAQSAYTASTKGLWAAMKESLEMQRQLKNGTAEVTFQMEELDASGKKVTKTITEKIPASTKLGAAFAGLSGIAAATATKIGGLVSKLGHIGEVIGIAVAVGGLLYAWLGNTSKQSAETSKSIDVLDSSLTNVNKTLEAISKKPAQLRFDTNSISAAATAIGDLGVQLVDTFEKSYAEIEAMNWADRLVDAVMPGSVEGRLVSRVSSGVEAAFKGIDKNSAAAKAAKEAIQDILKLDPKAKLSAQSIENALDGLSSSAKKNAIDNITNAIKSMGKELQVTASRGAELLSAFKKVEDARLKLAASFVPKDEFSQYGQDLIESSVKLGAALADPVQKYNVLTHLAKEYPKIAGATAETAIALQGLAEDVSTLNNASVRYTNSQEKLAAVEKELNSLVGEKRAKAILEGKKTQVSGLTAAGIDELNSLRKTIKALREESKESSDITVQVKLRIEQAQETINKAQLDVFKSGAEIVSASLSAEWAKAGNTISNAYASILSGTEAGIKLRAESEKAMISAQIAQIQSQRNLMISNQRLAIAIEKDAIARWKQNADAKDFPMIKPREDAMAAREAELNQVEAGKSNKGMYKDLTTELEAGKRQLTDLDTASLSFARNLEASGAAVANLRAQAKAVDISAADQSLMLQYEREQESLKARLASVSAKKADIALTKDAIGSLSVETLLAVQKQEAEERSIANASAELAIKAKILRLKQPGVSSQPGTSDEIAREEKNLADLKLIQAQGDATFRVTQLQELSKATLTKEGDERKRAKDLADQQLQTSLTQIDAANTLLEINKQTGAITSAQYISQKYTLDTEKARLETALKISDIKEGTASKVQELDTRAGAISAAATERPLTESENTALAQIAEQRKNILNTQQQSVSSAELLLNTNLANLSAVKEIALVQETWNARLSQVAGIATALKGVFGELGETIANGLTSVATSMADSAKLATENALAIDHYGKKAEEAYTKANGAANAEEAVKYTEEATAALKNQDKARDKAAKDEVKGYAKTLGAAKTMFKEKTGAYKVLNAVEKAMHAATLAMELKEMAVKLFTDQAETASKVGAEGAQTGATMAGTLARIPAYITEIYGKTIGQLGPIAGPAVATGLVALMLAALGGSGGGGSAPQIPTAEQRQETQGTAMSWQVKDGNLEKVQTRRGVFGDTDAKSESIANSLERIKETAVEGLSYDNRVVSLLSSISDGINGSAKALYRIEGLRTGSMFGTVEGTKGGGVFSGSLGGTTSTSIRDSGLVIKGTFAQLASDTNEAVLDLFEEVTKTKKSWYGKSKTSISTVTKEIDAPISQFFSDVFSNARDLFVEIGSTAKITENEINTILAGVTFDETKYSLRGLTGADLEKEVSSIISSMLDDASLAVFASFEQYAEFGEGMLETVIRVTDTNKKVSQALENMGIKVPDLGTSIFEVTESLAKLAGGMQDFADQSSFFTENFLDEAAQLAPSQKSVVKTFKDLGLAVPKTRKEFTNLVQGLNLADLSTHSTYQTLMDVATAFDAVSDAAEDAAKTGLETLKSELESSVTSLNSFIEGIGKLRDSLLLGSQSILTPVEKYSKAKSLFESTYANLSSADTTIAAAARASFSETANSFLEASRTYFASSEQYTSDFNSVLAKLDAAQAGAIAQVDNATLQLEALNSQLTILSNIDNGIAKLAGTTPLQAFAKGGYASGLAIVGEYGPEIVDFATPGRVYTADQTAGMFKAPGSGSQQQQAVVTELKALRQELAQLRKEQQAQTGDLIISNYSTSKETADTIATAIVSTTTETTWQDRSRVVIK